MDSCFPNRHEKDNPCYGCNRKNAPACMDTCPERQAWVEEGKRISRNRRTYYTKLGEEAKAAARRARKK